MAGDDGCSIYAGDDADLSAWPNCSIPDCDYKSCLSLGSNKCFAHTHGRNPTMSYEEYQSQPEPTNDPS